MSVRSTVLVIHEENARVATKRIMTRMRGNGGEWMLMTRGPSTIILARVGSVGHERMLKTATPCLSGPFTFKSRLGDLCDGIVKARRREVKVWQRTNGWSRQREADNRRRLRRGVCRERNAAA